MNAPQGIELARNSQRVLLHPLDREMQAEIDGARRGPGDSKSPWWEIEYMKEHDYLNKTLLLLHPKYGGKNNASDIIRKVEGLIGISDIRGAEPHGNCMALWLDAASRLRVGLASHFSRAHYLLMLRWFLRSQVGGGTGFVMP